MEFLHTMVRIADLDKSLEFYTKKLGLVEVRRVENEAGRFTLIFLAAPWRRRSRQRLKIAARRIDLQLGQRGRWQRPQFRPSGLRRR